ncbi:MAG: glycosyltransferase [Acidobacteria bacterium]|nr:glycosyltransferase [Acidobacteriota bacterium]
MTKPVSKAIKEPIRFCHVLDNCTPNPLLFNSIKYSNRARFDYRIIALRSDAGLVEQMAELGVPVRSLGYSSRKDAVGALWKLYSIFRQERIDIVQTHLMDASLIGLSAARLARVPVTIFTGHHSHETPLYQRRLLTFVDGSCGRFLAKHTIAPSEQMKEIFARDLKVPERKISVLYHGFDLENWREKARRNCDLRNEFGLEGKIVLGAVGRLFWVKNFENLIKGFARAAADRADVVLMIVGAGDRSGLQQLVESFGLQGKVILTGPRKDIAAVMNSFDVLVHPSLAESFGMIFIEAFALGKPILTTKVGVAPEIVVDGENGFLLYDGEPAAIADGIEKMLAAKERWKEMGEKGIKVSADFEVRKTQPICDEMYLQWLKEDPRR